MNYRIKNRDEHLQGPGPKRILTIDGGGLRGMFTLSLLEHIETMLGKRFGDGFRLAHYFDLMAGTSTGSVIAAQLAQGMTVSKVRENYNRLGHRVFKRTLFREGAIRAKYDKQEMAAALQDALGADVTMGGEEIQTGLMIMTKRRDTGSPWPVSNNPRGAYFEGNAENSYIPNKNYPLWRVARASTAAPAFFKGEKILLAEQEGHEPVEGEFVDGGVSPHNNPALQALMYATLAGHRIEWPMGADRLMLVSLGTGSRDPSAKARWFEAQNAIKSLIMMMDDCNDLVQTLLQWMSAGPTARTIDSEMGNLEGDLIGGRPLLHYMRYNIRLDGPTLAEEIGMNLDRKTLKRLAKLDRAENMPLLARIGKATAEKYILDSHFPPHFDLESGPE